MRTVTFSDAKIAKLVNENFVATWSNASPKFHNCERGTERTIATLKGEIFATRNIGTYILDCEGSVLHYFWGYYDPEHFAREVEFGLNVYRETRGDERALRFSALHSARARVQEEQIQSLRRKRIEGTEDFRREMEAMMVRFPDAPAEREAPIAGWGNSMKIDVLDHLDKLPSTPAILNSRREHLMEGLRHLVRVHRSLASRATQTNRLPAWREVRTAHAGANPFAEE